MTETKNSEVKNRISSDLLIEVANFGPKLTNMPDGIYLISMGIYEEGTRHECILAYAAYLKYLRREHEEIYSQCKLIAKFQSIRTGEDDFPKKEIRKIVNSFKKRRWDLLTSDNSEVIRRLEAIYRIAILENPEVKQYRLTPLHPHANIT